MSKRLRLFLLLACLAVALIASFAPSNRPVQAGTGIRYGIVNASGGIYWRSVPDWNTPVRVSGFGVYNDSVVELECYTWAGTVPGSLSHLWYAATHISGSGYGQGWLHDHFVATPWTDPDHVAPGVPRCQAVPPTQPPASIPGAAYYQPRNNGSDPQAPNDVRTYTIGEWSTNNCSDSKTTFPTSYHGRTVTTLAGWSLGRLGPVYAISHELARVNQQIDMIILYDPGDTADFFADWKDYLPGRKPPCDVYYDESWLYAQWLAANPSHELMILSGVATYSSGKYTGIKAKLFPDIAGRSIASQVLVCSYGKMAHRDVLDNFSDLMLDGRMTTCPPHPMFIRSFNANG